MIDAIIQTAHRMPGLKVDRQASSAVGVPSLLDQIKNEMRRQEVLKYPNPPYQCKLVPVAAGHINMLATYVYYDGSKLTDYQYDQMRTHSIVLRKLSILAGVVNAMHFSKTFLTNNTAQRAKLESRFMRLYIEAKKIPSRDESSEMDEFIDTLRREIEGFTGKSEPEIIRQIRNAERYFVAEYNRNHILVNETVYQDKAIVQIDIPFRNNITDEQKKNLMLIHNEEKSRPGWFRSLPVWEQEWFFIHVPRSMNDDWSGFISLFKSSAMPHMPGVNNGRVNYLLEKSDNDNYVIMSTSIKIGSMVAYEEPAGSMTEETRLTAVQVMNQLLSQAKLLFDDAWKGINFPPDIKPTIFISGLLSDTIGSSFDEKLMQIQKDVVQNLARNYNNANIITGNDPVNILRIAAVEGGRWHHTRQIIIQAQKLLHFFDSCKLELSADQRDRLELIRSARKELLVLSEMSNIPRIDRNMSAFKAAYTEILVEAMGGVVSTNCKSGKDRTGLDELYRHAMLLYFKRYKKLPGFTDSRQERQSFIEIFMTLFNSMKAQESAAANTPGSFGLNDKAKMLCGDLAVALGASYKCSGQRANMNKPTKFKKDEKVKDKEGREKSKLHP